MTKKLFEYYGEPSSKAKYDIMSDREKYREGTSIEIVVL
jgi:hypothetical protein